MSTWLHTALGWVLVTIVTAFNVTQVEVQASILPFFSLLIAVNIGSQSG